MVPADNVIQQRRAIARRPRSAEKASRYAPPSLEDRMLSLVCGLDESLWSTRVMAFFHAYVDDSGSHEDSPIFVLAGYLSTVRKWRTFTRRWQDALRRMGLQSFHMSQAEARRGKPYEDWTADQRQENILELGGLAKRFAIGAFGVETSRREFDAILKNREPWPRPIAKDLRTPYPILCAAIGPALAESCKHNGIDPGHVKIVFSAQSHEKLNRHAIGFAENALARCGFVERPEFEYSAKHAPLQAADMFAWMKYQISASADFVPRQRHEPILYRNINLAFLEAPSLRDIASSLSRYVQSVRDEFGL